MPVLDDSGARQALAKAWLDSEPNTPSAHEEGGFVLKETSGRLVVHRWPSGYRTRVLIPPHPGGVYQGSVIVATFHTHPLADPEYSQGPSFVDVFNVMDDTDLHHSEFEGEYVLSTEKVYRIRMSGIIDVIGRTTEVLGLGS